MKNLQTTFSKILLLCLLSFSVYGQAAEGRLAKADSLFRQKQFTQSFHLYQQLLSEKYYSPAMLLKMAYIQEGSNEIGLSLYYLNLYNQQTEDPQAVTKIAELASRYHLEGYSEEPAISFGHFLTKYGNQLSMAVASLSILLLAVAFYQKKKGQRPVFALVVITLLGVLLFFQVNGTLRKESGITNTHQTYLMTGPSAASSVWRMVGEGHKVTITGKKDVWLRVKWGEKEVYIKKSSVLPLSI